MSARARLEELLQRIEALNPGLGAFVEVAAQSALEAARAADLRLRRGAALGELDGLMLAVKDNIDVAGMHAAAGLQALRQRTPLRDAACIDRLRRHGAVFLGKTLMDEAALGALGDNPWFGRCHNPVRRGFTAGGSSAGSAAAVAAGLCRAALGTDTLGSVRIPASYCGVVGYLPGRGAIDAAGVVPLAPEFDRVGVLARSVADAARVAAAMSQRSLEIAAAPQASVGLLRGWEDLVTPAIAAALEDVARKLARDGQRVAEVSAGALDWGALRRAALLAIEIEGARIHAALLDDANAAISPALRAALEFGRRAAPAQVGRARERLQSAQRALGEMLSAHDLLLLPTTPQTAFAFDGAAPDTQADLTAPASIAGLAAISIPAGMSDGLPVGVQLFGRDDRLLLGVASRLG